MDLYKALLSSRRGANGMHLGSARFSFQNPGVYLLVLFPVWGVLFCVVFEKGLTVFPKLVWNS